MAKSATIDFSLFTVPAQKITDLNIATFNSAVESQQAAAKSMLSLAEERTKAAMEIKDFDGLVSFMKDQAELTQSNAEKMAEDSKAAMKDAQAYFAEIQSILSDSSEAVKETVESLAIVPAAPTAPARKTTKKAA